MTRYSTLALHTLLASALLLVGLGLVAFMVVVEGEPGALPLLLVVAGGAWLIVTRWRVRRRARPAP